MLLCTVFWGYSFISTKIILNQLPPVSIAFFRQIIAVIFLFVWLKGSKQLNKISLKDIPLVALGGFFGIVLYFIFENRGIQLSTASNASMIVAAVPVFTMFSEALFFKEKITFIKILSLILSFVGVYMVVTENGKLDFSSGKLLGNFLVLFAMLSWVIYTLINKKLDDKGDSKNLTFWQSLFSIFLFIPFIIPEINHWQPISLYSTMNLLYLGIFCSALAYVFYIFAARILGSTVCSAFLNLIPVVSVIAGVIVLGEKITLFQIFGMLIIMASLFMLLFGHKNSKYQ